MAFITFKNIGITGVSACVPKEVIKNINYKDLVTDKELNKIIKTTGIYERRFARNNICSSDLCFEAAKTLIQDMNIDRKSIDMLIFLSQTPDYKIPATAPILQDRLGLPNSTGSFDINLACSGYVYGLSTAFSYVSQEGINKVLLLVGDTLSKVLSSKDRSTSLLFADGGSATLIEKNKRNEKSFFSLNSDEAGYNHIIIKSGGLRNPSSFDTLKEKVYNDGSILSDEQLFMNGIEVFNFTLNVVSKDILNLLKNSKYDISDIDYIVFHQANKYITDFLVKKLKYDLKKVPYSIQKFGNTSSVSIPLTIVSEMKDTIQDKKQMSIFSGFGAGLSWATSLMDISTCHISKLIEL